MMFRSRPLNNQAGFLRSASLALVLAAVLAPGLVLHSASALANDAEENKVKAYIKKQKAAGTKPKASSPNWKKGYTCNDLKKQSFDEYQECRYYYEENGRFYPG